MSVLFLVVFFLSHFDSLFCSLLLCVIAALIFFSVNHESHIRIILLFRVHILILSHQMIFHTHADYLSLSFNVWISSGIARIHIFFRMIYLISVHGLVDHFVSLATVIDFVCQEPASIGNATNIHAMWWISVLLLFIRRNLTLMHSVHHEQSANA